jgi:DNA-binding winged helix-turn-helix (wHTH) protein/TolB-like protein/Tfp pilus assembly protein PilF
MGYVLRFGVFELNLVSEELRKFGTPIKLAPQPFKVLALLASQSGQVVTREQIQLQVWGEDTYVDFEQGMNHCIKQIRNALSDTADTPRYIETLPRRGYRFIVPVEARKLPGGTPEVHVSLIEPGAAVTVTSAATPLEAVEPSAGASNSTHSEFVRSPAEQSPDAALDIATQSHTADRMRPWRMVALATVFVAIALALYAAWRTRVTNQQAASSLSSMPALHQRKAVAVLGFQNVSGRADAAWYSIGFSEWLRTELAAGEELRIVEGETVDRMKADLHLAETDSLSKDSLQKIQKMIGADYVVLGSYTDLGKDSGGKIRLDVRLQDARSGETLTSKAETGTLDTMIDMVSRAGANVRSALGARPVSTEDAIGVRAMLPSNQDAARLYSQALAKLRVFDAMAARDLLRESISVEPFFAPAHSTLAAAWKMLGHEKDAKEEAQTAFKLASSLPREEQISIEARYRELSSQWDEAIRLYQVLWHDYPDNIEYGLRLASAQKSSGKAKDSLATVETLRTLPAPSRDDPRIDLAEASAENDLGNLKQSQDAATRAAQKSESLGSSNILAKAKTAQAKVLFLQQDLPAALNLFRQSRDIYQQVGDATGVTSSLDNIASVLQEQGQLADAQGMYEKALAIHLKAGDKSSAALTLNNMGAVFERERNFTAAKNAYRKSLDLYLDLGDKLNQSFVLYNYGEVQFLDGDLAGARKTHESVLALDREITNQLGTAEALLYLGQVLSAQDDLADARKSLDEALKIWTDIGETDSANKTRLALAKLALAEGRWSDAEGAARNLATGASQKKQADLESRSQIVLSQALLQQDKMPEANAAAVQAESLATEAGEPDSRLSIRILASRVRGLSGTANAQLQAMQTLQQCVAEAAKGGFLEQHLEAELALGEIEIAAGKGDAGRARLQSLQKQAASRGFLLIARQATAARGRLSASK